MSSSLSDYNPCEPDSEGRLAADFGYAFYKFMFSGECACCAFYRGLLFGVVIGVTAAVVTVAVTS